MVIFENNSLQRPPSTNICRRSQLSCLQRNHRNTNDCGKPAFPDSFNIFPPNTANSIKIDADYLANDAGEPIISRNRMVRTKVHQISTSCCSVISLKEKILGKSNNFINSASAVCREAQTENFSARSKVS